MKQALFFILFLLVTVATQAQEPTDSLTVTEEEDVEFVKPNVDEDEKLGIKLGSGITSMVGGEPNHPRPAVYLTGGVYGRFKFKPHWALQPEINFSYKGSNFNNNDGELGSIKAYYLEVPVMVLKGLNERNTSNIAFGLQYSRLLSAVLYTTNGNFPENQTPSLNKDDLVALGGMQFHTPFIGFQLFLKYGLLNANQGLIPTILPLNTGKSMHHITFEISFIF